MWVINFEPGTWHAHFFPNQQPWFSYYSPVFIKTVLGGGNAGLSHIQSLLETISNQSGREQDGIGEHGNWRELWLACEENIRGIRGIVCWYLPSSYENAFVSGKQGRLAIAMTLVLSIRPNAEKPEECNRDSLF